MKKPLRELKKTYTFKSKKGITIVALIVTIVIMLILASITISAINGNLLNYTGQGKIKTEIIELNASLMKKLLISDNKKISGKINDILKIDSPYNDKLEIENGELVYIGSKWTEEEIEMLEEMGIGMSIYGVYKENTTIYYIANSSTKIAKYSDLPNVGTLEDFRDRVNAGTFTYNEAKLIEDIKLNEGKYTVTNEGITFAETATEWTPIGNKFTGTLDGQDFSINGIYINSASKEQGLFSKTSTTTIIKNLGIKNSYIKGNGSVGGIAGANYGLIDKCFNEAILNGTGDGTGGIAGGNQSGARIENCWNNNNITGSQRQGGICGVNGGTIKGCYNTGTISGTSIRTGGICGISSGTIEKCYNYGEIPSGGYALGGITGENSGTVSECFNKKLISVNSNKKGGIVGDNKGTVSSCYNTGDLTNTKGQHVGGIVGANSNTVKNCYNTGVISSTQSPIGLIVGNNASTSTVTDCYALTAPIELIGKEDSENTARCLKKSLSEMQAQDNSFINLLNTGLTTNVWLTRTNDYPKLSWEQ